MCRYCLPNTAQSVKVSRIVLLVTTGDYFRTLFSLGENRGLINFFNIFTLCLLFGIRPHRCKCCWSDITEAWVNIESVYYSYKTPLYSPYTIPSTTLTIYPIYSFQPEELSTPSNLRSYLHLPTCVIYSSKLQILIYNLDLVTKVRS